MKYRCLIIDDDPLIGDLLKHFCGKTDLVEYCVISPNATDGLHLLTNGDFNLIFLDFNLPDMTGQSFMELKKNKIPVIMITSTAEFAVKSYEYADIRDYMIKPLSYDRFLKAIQKVSMAQITPDEAGSNPMDSIFIKDGNKNVKIRLNEVLFIKSENNYVSFVLSDSQTLSLYSLKDLETKLPPSFVRVHRSYIANMDKVDFITTDELSIKGKLVPIGEKYKDVLAKLSFL